MKKMLKNSKWFFVLASIFWMEVIFLFSSEPNLRSSFSDGTDFIMRKIAHIGEYFILTVLLYKALLPRAKSNLILGVFLIAFSWAVLDECHQLFVEGREGTIRDVLFDAVGILSAIYYFFRRERRKSK